LSLIDTTPLSSNHGQDSNHVNNNNNNQLSNDWSKSYYKWSIVDEVVLKNDLFIHNNHTNIELCLLSEKFSCYELFVDDVSEWSEKIYWELLGEEGNVVATGKVPSTVNLCSEELCDDWLITVDMLDSYGDG
jgi:hypothetical protein